MAVDGYLNFDTRISTKGFAKGINAMNSMLGELAAAVGIAFSVGALVAFGKEAVELASDMQEVQNVVDTAFGDMAYKMEEFANSSIKQFGISRLAAKQTGSTFAAMASGMGIALDAASDMAVALTGLSADMASFYNVSQDVASTALKSVFTGETETLKQFGIVMTEANLQAYAMSQGITKSLSAMTQAEKVMLRYNYVMQMTTLAQGDFAKTSGGWANQTRILSEQWKEFSGIVGNALMNVALPSIRNLNDALSKLITYANGAYNALAEFFGWEQVQSNAVGITNEIASSVDEQNALTDAVNATAKAQQNALAGFDKINKLSGSADTSAGTAVAITPSVSTAQVTDRAKEAAKETKSIFSGIFGDIDFTPLLDSLGRLRDAAEPITGHVGDGLKWVYDNVLTPLGEWVIKDALPVSVDVLTAALDLLDASIETLRPCWDWLWEKVLSPAFQWTGDVVIAGLQGLANSLTFLADKIRENSDIEFPTFDTLTTIQDIAGIFSEFWQKWAQPIFENLKKAFSGWVATTQKIWNSIGKPIFDKICETVGTLWEEHVKPFLSNMLDFIGNLVNSALEIYNKFVLPMVNWLVDILGPVFTWLAEEAIEYLADSFGFLIDAASNIIDALNGIVNFVTGVFTGDWEKAWDGIKSYFTGIFEAFGNVVLSFAHVLIDWMVDAVDGIKDAFRNIGTWFGTKFTEAWNRIKTAFANVKTWFTSRWNDITGIFSGVGTWFSTQFTNAYTKVTNAFSGAGEYFSGILGNIQEHFSGIGSWFSTQFQTAYDNITGIFDGIGGYFSGIWEDLSTGAKDGVNWMIDRLNSLADSVESLLNGVVDGLNAALSFSIPDSVPLIGGTSFGLDLSHVNIPEIPRLATGTVVPANFGEFLAILGDNKREAEIVSPISTIEKAMENVLSRRKQDSGDIHLNVTLDGKTVYRTVIKKNNESIRMTGKNPLNPATKGVTT